MGVTYPAGRKRGAGLLLPTSILKPSNVIGHKLFGLASFTANSVLNRTWQHKFCLEADFDAIQLVYYNHQPNDITNATAIVAATETASTGSTNNISQPIVGGTAYTNKDDTAEAYGWRSVTWSGAASPTLPAGTAAIPTITTSDWIPIQSVPRADGGIGRLLLVRVYINGSVNQFTAVSTGQIDAAMRTASAANRGRTLQVASYDSGDAVGTQTNSPTALGTIGLAIGVNIRTRGVGLSVMSVGDSTAQCVTLVADKLSSWAFRACADVSTEEFPVTYINHGQSSVNSAAYQARALEGAAIWQPGAIVFQALSPNDTSTNIGTFRYENLARMARLQQLLSYCQSNRIALIVNTGFPKNYSSTIDAERINFNTRLREMAARGHILLCDMDSVLSDGATPARIRSAFNYGDDIHPNEAGVEAMSQELRKALRRLIATR